MPRLISPRQQTLTGRAIEAFEPPFTRLRGESVLNYPRLFWNFCSVPTGILFCPPDAEGRGVFARRSSVWSIIDTAPQHRGHVRPEG
ncbi:hypothetical protein CABS03_09162 [Colletotrichum abscissum]|uniref:Uncharacterized protein n=1 Tax=Colletotrichum abscissum TaxID=1671311 RepID=A0A9P9XG52_9PEZI|nr:hypothetical protein CABS02_07253 [Colletotrichum abscissum]